MVRPIHKKWRLFFLFSLFGSCVTYSQKPAIDTGNISLFNYGNWSNFRKPLITNDGSYIAFFYNNAKGEECLKVRSSKPGWQIEIPETESPSFTKDGHYIVIRKKPDLLVRIKLGTNDSKEFSKISAHTLVPAAEGNWLAVLDKRKTLRIYDTNLESRLEFDSVNNYYFDEKGKYLYLQRANKINDTSFLSLSTVSVTTGLEKTFWSSNPEMPNPQLSKLILDRSGQQVAFFLTIRDGNTSRKSLWYYNTGTNEAIEKLSPEHLEKKYGRMIDPAELKFSEDGSQLIFYAINSQKQNEETIPGLEIWNYSDPKLVSDRQDPMTMPSRFLMTIHVNDSALIELTGSDERLEGVQRYDKWILVNKREGSEFETNWNPLSTSRYYLVSCNTGSRKLIREVKYTSITNSFEKLFISPTGKWITYYDADKKSFFSYEIETGVRRNLTANIPVSFIKEGLDRRGISLSSQPVWIRNEQTLLLHDNYDIWLIDPSLRRPPENLTNGYGKRNKIKFEYISFGNGADSSRMILAAFNLVNKENGFFSIDPDKKADPEKLTMGPYIYSWKVGRSWKMDPVKAANNESYLVKRMSATEAPNLFLTSDFTSFEPITDFNPERSVNWLTTELISWKTEEGNVLNGVLYKPENFDPAKKYPVIFHFYERMSDELNEFKFPGLTESAINIPWFVSSGYIIVTPDIKYKIGDPGESAYNAVISCARFMAKKNWVDAGRMGLQGHSWGAYQVNYIITRTGIFSAAAEVAGMTDLISDYGLISHGGKPRSGWLYETGQSRMGTTLWKNINGYVRNSPLLSADKVQTPVLIMHNKNDWQVPWSQGLEWFTALRRLNKKAWMLQYNNGGHYVEGKDALDYTLRLTQYFDHYLKDAPAPIWMTKGVPAQLKRIENGYALDSSGVCGSNCVVCKKINILYNKVRVISTAMLNNKGVAIDVPDEKQKKKKIAK